MGRPKSKEVEATEAAIEKMHQEGKLTAETNPRDVAARLSPSIATKMGNRVSPILKEAKTRYGLTETEDRAADWRKEMRRLTAKIDELGGPERVESMITEFEKLDKQLRQLGGISGAKQAMADLDAVVNLYKATG